MKVQRSALVSWVCFLIFTMGQLRNQPLAKMFPNLNAFLNLKRIAAWIQRSQPVNQTNLLVLCIICPRICLFHEPISSYRSQAALTIRDC